MVSEDISERIHYTYVPSIFVVVFTLLTQILAVYGTTRDDVTWSVFGNSYSWQAVGLLIVWAYVSLVVPGKEYKGPSTSSGYIPVYKANGFQYFLVTFSVYSLLLIIRPQTALEIAQNFPQITATCNIIAIILCCFLLYKGKFFPEKQEHLEEKPLIFEFYRGMEIHPRILGVDVKQMTNCRFGLMAWLLLTLSFFVCNSMNYGFSMACFVCVLLQTIYLGKFYWWETGYFNTLDITLDRAGYYICWGCLVWVPVFYTFASYLLASRPSLVGVNGAWLILVFGIVATGLNYWVDYQKQYFRNSGGRCSIWGRQATYIVAPYKTTTGANRRSQLLTSGFWGIARHLNYLFEILTAFSWSFPAAGYGIWPYMYPIFLTVLLIHRIYRDEKKCSEEYGDAWKEYCRKVPYRMIPGVF